MSLQISHLREHYDLIIVGGGIHGAGVCQAAAAAGYTVLLLEKSGPAAGTSSRSSKLIHGGLRYLESAQFSLVRESLRERELLLKNAPSLVKLVPFYIPVYKQTTRASWQIRVGLSLYSLLGGFSRNTRFRSVPLREWDQFTGLKRDGLQAVFEYFDAQTDDADLTRAVLNSARQLGAESLWPASFLSALKTDTGYEVRLSHEQRELTCNTTVLVNAAGPWVNLVQQRIEPTVPRVEVELVQGAHIALESPICPGILYVEHPADQRAVFIMPWKEGSLIGTTETIFQGSPDQVTATDQEISYLKRALQHYFPEAATDICDQFAGLRVLPVSDGSPFSRSRETKFVAEPAATPSYLAIYGGKLTGYRATAEKALRRILPSLPHRDPVAATDQLPLE